MASNEIDVMLEDDTWLMDSPPRILEPVTKPLKRAKALNIDDLLKDHYKEKNKNLDRESKRAKFTFSDSESSDDESFLEEKTETELQFESLVETCERQVHACGGTFEVLKWGEKVFGVQRRGHATVEPKLGGLVVQALSAARERTSRSLLESEQEDGTEDTLMTELLTTGWLFQLGVSLGQFDETILRWVFHQMAYSIDRNAERSACDFLCKFLHQAHSPAWHWKPSFDSIMTVFQAYGYLGTSSEIDVAPNEQRTEEEILEADGPPRNLGSFLRFLTAAFETRQLHQAFSALDAENLLVLIATLLLDRRLLISTILVQECLESIVNSFTKDEWPTSCERIATSMMRSDRQIVNCLRLTRCLHSSGSRMKQLRKSVALHFLSTTTGNKVLSGGVWEVLLVFRKADLKDKAIDFVKLYYQMALAEIWLWCNPVLLSNQSALEAWILFLKSCSCQISSTDWRPYASKVRNWASYLLQIYEGYRQPDDYEES